METPPVTAYVATHAGDELEIEFITSAKGSGEGVRSVQSSLTAQELRYVDLLLANKWFLPLDVLSVGELEGAYGSQRRPPSSSTRGSSTRNGPTS